VALSRSHIVQRDDADECTDDRVEEEADVESEESESFFVDSEKRSDVFVINREPIANADAMKGKKN
jgi:hypothetical protein